LTINSRAKGATTTFCFPPSEVPVSYRKVLVKNYHVAIASARQTSLAAAHPRFQNNRLLLPPGTAWRVIDTRGRQVAFIKPETRLMGAVGALCAYAIVPGPGNWTIAAAHAVCDRELRKPRENEIRH
jgi:hypothetical protein